jgi:perosamine synthetase
MTEAPWAFSTFWLYTVLIDEREFGIDSRTLRRALGARAIEARPLWQPLHVSIPHRMCQSYEIEIADDLYRRALSLPSSVGLATADQERVIEAVVGAGASRGAGLQTDCP